MHSRCRVPQHPGARLAHSGVGLIDHSSEEEVGDTVKNFRGCDQGAYNTHAESNRIGQIDHHECSQQRIDAVSCNVAGAVADLCDTTSNISFPA